MYSEYKDKGLEILGFACNQFLKQEPATNQEIKQFAREEKGAEFPLFSKIDVNGENIHEIYKYLRTNSGLFDKESEQTGMIPWNFSKFLVDRDGKVVKFYDVTIYPENIIPDIEKLLD